MLKSGRNRNFKENKIDKVNRVGGRTQPPENKENKKKRRRSEKAKGEE